jgi:hypothetical protein
MQLIQSQKSMQDLIISNWANQLKQF